MASNLTEHAFVLPTKLHPPHLMEWAVARPQLLERLAQNATSRVTLVSAPAGYGKTTLVTLWLNTDARPKAWLSLDQHDSELTTFAAYLSAAVKVVYPQFGRSTQTLINNVAQPKPHHLANHFLADLLELDGPLILVLDDYHLITDLDVHSFLGRLLEHLPTTIHLALITWFDPPLPLARRAFAVRFWKFAVRIFSSIFRKRLN